MNYTDKLLARLWQCQGHPNYPSEWDGKVLGGGKISQRFWEYHETLKLLELTPDSVVLDIGGGSPETGIGFFTRVISPLVKQVHVMDVNLEKRETPQTNIVMHHSLANYESLGKLLKENPQITHVASVSVFEHIPPDVRIGITKAINDHFAGDIFVATVEYHAKDSLFEYQLTTQTLSETFGMLERFYPDQMHKSPFWCQNAFAPSSIGRMLLRRFGISSHSGRPHDPEVPLWYPVALRFRRCQ